MKDDKQRNDSKQRSDEELWGDFLEVIKKQIEIIIRLRAVVEQITGGTASGSTGATLTGELAEEIQNLFIENEALLGEERALYHSLLGFEE